MYYPQALKRATYDSRVTHSVDEKRQAEIEVGVSISHSPQPPPPIDLHHDPNRGESDLDT